MNEANGLNEVMFTSASVLDLLLKIEELKDYTVGMTETFDGNLQLQIGNSIYILDTQNATTIRVDDEVVGEIEMQTEEAYNEISDEVSDEYDMPQYTDSDYEDFDSSEYENSDESIEGGILKEIAKSLALGGLIRFATKRLLK